MLKASGLFILITFFCEIKDWFYAIACCCMMCQTQKLIQTSEHRPYYPPGRPKQYRHWINGNNAAWNNVVFCEFNEGTNEQINVYCMYINSLLFSQQHTDTQIAKTNGSWTTDIARFVSVMHILVKNKLACSAWGQRAHFLYLTSWQVFDSKWHQKILSPTNQGTYVWTCISLSMDT